MRSSPRGQSGKGQSSSGKDLSPHQPTPGKAPCRGGGGALRLLPAPALMKQKPGSVTSQSEKVHEGDTQLIRCDGLPVPCPDNVAAILGAGTLRTQLRTRSQEVVPKSFMNDLTLTCHVSTCSSIKWSQQSLTRDTTSMSCQVYRIFVLPAKA